MEDILKMMVEISFTNPDNFLKIKETLCRIGVSSEEDRRLYPSCVLLHKRGKYYISHFKLLFALDGKTANISTIDLTRQKTIASLVCEWGLCDIVGVDRKDECKRSSNMKLVRIIPFRDKDNWEIIHKYTIGSCKEELLLG